MGTFGTPSSYNNTGTLGSATNPTTAQGLSRDRENQKAILELDGTQAYESISILDGSISPKRAEIIVDTEGGASADTLETILTNTDGSTTLHDGMKLTLRSADPSRTVTVKHSNSEFGIRMVGGQDVVLGTKWGLKLKLITNKWYEDQGRAEILASEAMDTAEEALGRTAPATTTSRGIARVATLADMEPGATVENGPAVLAAGSEALNALVPTFLIGSIISTYAADGYVPNGCVLPDGAEYTQSQFPSFYTDYLVAGKIVTCTYTEFAAQVALTGNCGKFALDTANQTFKVPFIKDGDSITQAASAAELGKSVKAGLPNITGTVLIASNYGMVFPTSPRTGAFVQGSTVTGGSIGSTTAEGRDLKIDASLSDPTYGNSTTVTDEQVRLRHFVVVASAQNNASVFDWSNYMAGLAGKANTDLSNATSNAIGFYFYARDEKTSGTAGGTSSSATWHTRDLNTIKQNFIGATLSNNRITLPPGRYYVRASAPILMVSKGCRLALYSVTDSAYLSYGASYGDNGSIDAIARLLYEDEMTLAQTTTLELRSYITAGYATIGLGRPTNLSGVPEIYSELRIWKM